MKVVGAKVDLRKIHLKFLTRWNKHLTSQEVGGEGGVFRWNIRGVYLLLYFVKSFGRNRKHYFL